MKVLFFQLVDKFLYRHHCHYQCFHRHHFILKSLIIVTECYGRSSGAVVHSKDLLHKLTTRTSTSCGKTTTNHSLLKEKPSSALIACTNNRAAKVRGGCEIVPKLFHVLHAMQLPLEPKGDWKMFYSFKQIINELIEVGLGFLFISNYINLHLQVYCSDDDQ